MMSSTALPVTASIRRIPAAILLSDKILIIPMFPVFLTCVPPHNSTEEPYLMTRTSSPYFSPNNAIAPNSLAWAIGMFLNSSNAIASRTFLLARRSTFWISSSVIFWKWEKSKRRNCGETYEPFCSTCVPNTSRSASWSRWVAVWFAAVAWRASLLISAVKTASTFFGSCLVIWTGKLFSRLVSVISITSSPLYSLPVSPTCPPISA